MLWVSLGSLVVLVLPAMWLARRSFEQAHVANQVKLLDMAHAELAVGLDRRLAAAEASVDRFSALLSWGLAMAPPGDAAGFDALVHALPDGSWRSDPDYLDGTLEAGILVTTGVELDERAKALYLGAKRLVDQYARGGSIDWDNLWVLPARGGEVIHWPNNAEFLFQAPADLDYGGTEWVELTRPESNPGGRPRWTSASYDDTSGSWMLSVVAPFFVDGVWAGSTGHDVLLSSLAIGLDSSLLLDGTSTHLVRGDGRLLHSERHAGLIEASRGGADTSATGDPLLIRSLAELAASNRFSEIAQDDTRTLLVQRLQHRDWYFVSEVPHQVLLASVREHYDVLWTAFVGVMAILALAPLVVATRLVRRSVRGLVSASRDVAAGGSFAVAGIGGPREFRTIAAAIELMLARLEESRERIRAVLETVADGVITVSEKGLIESVNRSAAGMFGCPAESLAGQKLSVLGPAFRSVETLLEGSDDSTSWTFDAVPDALHADGHGFPVEVRARLSVAGGSHHVTLTVRDLTRRQQAERTRRALEDQLRQAQKMEAVGQLAGGVAHDFNNLLTGIMGYAEGLRAVLPEGGEPAHDVAQILRAAERAAGLTRQLLLFSRRQELRPEEVDLNQLLIGITPMLQRLLGVGLELRLDQCHDLGSVLVDPSRMEQVVMNLVVNAADAMPDGGEIRLATSECTFGTPDAARPPSLLPGGRYVCLTVSDTGTGMDDQTKASIFEPFFTTKEPGKGTGLGLSTVFGIVQESGGDVAVVSSPGRGATFRVFLPRHGEVRAASEVPGDLAPRGGSETVLVVDDEPTVRRLLRRLLEDQGYRVLVACDGDDALKIAEAHPGQLDLLLSDIVMPGLSGPALAAEFLLRWPDTPVLFMSGYSIDALAGHEPSVDAAAIVAKPFGLADMCRRVRDALDRAATPG